MGARYGMGGEGLSVRAPPPQRPFCVPWPTPPTENARVSEPVPPPAPQMAIKYRDPALISSASWLWMIASIAGAFAVSAAGTMFQLSTEVVAAAYGLTTFSSGVLTAPLLALATVVNPSIINTAAVVAVSTFAVLSAVALRSNKRQYLWLGGFLSMGVWGLIGVSPIGRALGGWLLGAWFRELVFSMELYLGLAMFIGYVLFDTQLIIAKAEGSSYPDAYAVPVFRDAVQLFTDLLGIFVRLVIILLKAQEAASKREREREERRRA